MKTLRLIGLLLASAAATAGAQQVPVDKEVPAEYMPPKGMCRIWLKDVPPKQQPAPTDCPAAIKNVPPNGRVIFGEKKEKPKPETMPSTVKGYTRKGGPPPVIIKKPPF